MFEQCQNCGAIGIGGIIWVLALLITIEIVSINSRKNQRVYHRNNRRNNGNTRNNNHGPIGGNGLEI